MLCLGIPADVFAGSMEKCDFMDMSTEMPASTTTDCCDFEDSPAEMPQAPPCDMDALCGCDSGQTAAKQISTLPSAKNLSAVIPIRFQVSKPTASAAFISAPEGNLLFPTPPIFLLNSSFLN